MRSLDYARRHLMGRRGTVVCADGTVRMITFDSVDSDGVTGWYVTGLDRDRYRHGAYIMNDFSNVIDLH